MATQAEAAAELQVTKTQLIKIGTETTALLARIQDLLAAVVAAGNVGPELQAAVDGVKAQGQIVDDLVPDVPPPPAP